MTDPADSPLPKGTMLQPAVYAPPKPDQPNSPRHATLRSTWQLGQYWETRIDGQTIWCPVGNHGYAEPTWDANQEYRQATIAACVCKWMVGRTARGALIWDCPTHGRVQA